MKLLFVLSEYLPESGGGIISYYAGILPRLVDAGHTVDVLVLARKFLDRPSHIMDGVQITYLKQEYLETVEGCFERYRFDFPTFAAFLPLAWAAYEQVQHGLGYDLVETSDFQLLFAPWVISDDSPPAVVALHGSCGQLDWYASSEKYAFDGDYLRLVESKAFSSASGVYTNSESNSKFWEAATNRQIPILPPDAEQKIKLSPLAPDHADYGVVIGRFQNWKGPRVLCHALKQLQGKQIRWFGSDVVDLSTGKVHSDLLSREFPGLIGSQLILEKSRPRKEIFYEIVSAAYLCVPSEWDVFNLTVIEAMTLGTPVICSKNAGASMLIEHGKNGFLFDPNEPDQLVSSIQTVLGLTVSQKKSLTENALQTLRQRLDAKMLMTERIKFYKSVIEMDSNWKADEWLQHALSPRNESDLRGERLRAFTAHELIKAAGIQLRMGLQRRFEVLKK